MNWLASWLTDLLGCLEILTLRHYHWCNVIAAVIYNNKSCLYNKRSWISNHTGIFSPVIYGILNRIIFVIIQCHLKRNNIDWSRWLFRSFYRRVSRHLRVHQLCRLSRRLHRRNSNKCKQVGPKSLLQGTGKTCQETDRNIDRYLYVTGQGLEKLDRKHFNILERIWCGMKKGRHKQEVMAILVEIYVP